MPSRKKRPSAAELAADRAIIVALQDLVGYTPTNPACSVESLLNLVAILDVAEEAEIRANRAQDVAREHATAAGQNVHNAVLETKVQVMAQYGTDSPVVHAVGLKQRSERKPRTRRAA